MSAIVLVARDEMPAAAIARRQARGRAGNAKWHARAGRRCPCGQPILRDNRSGLCAPCYRRENKAIVVPCRRCSKALAGRRKTGLCLACLRPGRPAAVPSPCRHCGATARCRPRGLCNRCYKDPAVRLLYEPLSAVGRQVVAGTAVNNSAGRPATDPTDVPPGSGCKMAVLAARAARGESLFHPGDRELSG